MYVYIRVYTLLVYIHVYIGQNQVYITTLHHSVNFVLIACNYQSVCVDSCLLCSQHDCSHGSQAEPPLHSALCYVEE